MKISLILRVTPLAVQSVRFANIGGFMRKYQPRSNQDYKGCIKALALNQLPDDFELFTGPIKVDVEYIFPPLKSMSKKLTKSIEEGFLIYKDTKPDLSDNLNKGTFDALTGIVWLDDSQIVQLSAKKVYGSIGMIRMEIKDILEL